MILEFRPQSVSHHDPNRLKHETEHGAELSKADGLVATVKIRAA